MASCSSCLIIWICFSSSVSSCITEVLAILRDSAFPLVVKEARVSLLTCGRGISWCCRTVTSFCPSSVQMYFFRWQLPVLAVFHTACWLFPTWDLNREVWELVQNQSLLLCVCISSLWSIPLEKCDASVINCMYYFFNYYYLKAQFMNTNSQMLMVNCSWDLNPKIQVPPTFFFILVVELQYSQLQHRKT